MTARDGLDRYAAGAKPVTDDWPSIEYATWVRRGEFGRVLPEVLALRTPPTLIDASAAFQAEVRARQSILLEFYASGLAAFRGDRDAWARALKAALTADPTTHTFDGSLVASRTLG